MIRDDELNRLIAESIHDEEEGTLSLMKQLDDREVIQAFNVLIQLRKHRRIER